jgi:serine/threonine protein kinase
MEVRSGCELMKFQCPDCGQALETQTMYAGQTASCPKCGAGVVVSSAASGIEHPAGSGIPLNNILTSEQNKKYEVGGLVAQGGMGAILNAKDVNLRRNVAMKVMLEKRSTSEAQVYRFIEEAQVTGQLEHPGIVPLYEP